MKVFIVGDMSRSGAPYHGMRAFLTFESARAHGQQFTTATSKWTEEVTSIQGERAWQNQLDGSLWIIEREVES